MSDKLKPREYVPCEGCRDLVWEMTTVLVFRDERAQHWCLDCYKRTKP